jgi:hypothetical protein
MGREVEEPSASGRGAPRSVRLKPADPFELIRWLARSQPDPRKAVAELVQNALDAGAAHVALTRRRVKGVVELVIFDDGEGVLPGRDREGALRHLASHIGHSHKLALDPGERARRVVAGQYGVGLLGFWAIGQTMVIRSRVGGGEVAWLRMREESPTADVGFDEVSTRSEATFTEITIHGVHAASLRALGGRRLADYLAMELRGQLLRSDRPHGRPAHVTLHDALARGRESKDFVVEPRRYTGQRLAVPATVEVSGHPPARVELYRSRGEERPAIQLACAGTRVADDIAELSALGLSGAPWTGCELTGVVDFAAFSVPPGTRRGVMPNEAALAFVEAMARLSPLIEAELAKLDAEQREELDKQVVRDLRRALRGFRERLPQYDLPTVGATSSESAPELAAVEGTPDVGAPVALLRDVRPEEGDEEESGLDAGPVASVQIVPAFVRIAPGGERTVRAVCRDVAGRKVDAGSYEWRLPDGDRVGVTMSADGKRARLTAAEGAPMGGEVALMAVAWDDEHAEPAAAVAAVRITEDTPEVYARLGIPEPTLVHAPDARWRSRMRGYTWEINDAHPDCVRVAGDARRRIRYLVALLGKEIVMASTGRTDTAEVLESLVEVMVHAEGNLR